VLEIITGLWTGEPFSYDGNRYTVTETVMKPTPVQEPRIPIISGGLWPNKKPFYRGAHCDGMIPHYRGDGVIPTERVDREQSGDLSFPERPSDAATEVRAMAEYYFEDTGGTGELFLPADPPHAGDG